jgi:hypothetical protein
MAVKHLARQTEYIVTHYHDIVTFPVPVEAQSQPPGCFTRQSAFTGSPAECCMRLGIRETGSVNFVTGFQKF